MRIPLRLLTVTVFVSALLLTLRLGELWRGIEVAVGSPSAAQSAADESDAAAGGPRARPDTSAPPQDDILSEFSDAEIDVLQNLAARRENLDRREREIATRDGLLKAAEDRIDAKITELKGLRGQLEKILKQYDDEEKANMASLVKIYENMKPKDAARIFGKLEMDILLEMVGRMREAKAAPILAKMDPAKAKSVTSELAQRRELSQALK